MKALLVVDMLNDFVNEKGVLFVGPQVEKVITFVYDLILQHRRTKNLIVYVCDSHRLDDAEFRLFPPHCVEGSWGAQIIEKLGPDPKDLIISKRRFSAFFGTPLDLSLRERGIWELEMVGVCTNICVLYTCAEARMLGYGVRVYQQGVTSFDLDSHRWALKEMAQTLKAEVV
ncbi:MAG: cysteine hydrolase family protein [Candidatus Caldatribacteriaceae bacterium]